MNPADKTIKVFIHLHEFGFMFNYTSRIMRHPMQEIKIPVDPKRYNKFDDYISLN